MTKRKLVLENGMEFPGEGFGAPAEAMGEAVFFTTMAGYQEVFSDPANTGLLAVMTYPVIGSYGMNDEDGENRSPALAAFVVRDYNDSPSNFRYTKTLAEAMEEFGVPGLMGVDTRRLTRVLRREGAQKALLTDMDTTAEQAALRLAAYTPRNAEGVGCKKRWYARTPNPRYTVAALDLGIAHSTVSALQAMGCNVTVVPQTITAPELLALSPDGVFFSNGPGSPLGLTGPVALARELAGRLPLYGQGLGSDVLALAMGARVEKLKNGHRGANHPVQGPGGLIDTPAQNHGWAVTADSLAAAGLTLTHTNLLDGTVEGFACPEKRLLGTAFAPGGSGPAGSESALAQFDAYMGEGTIHA